MDGENERSGGWTHICIGVVGNGISCSGTACMHPTMAPRDATTYGTTVEKMHRWTTEWITTQLLILSSHLPPNPNPLSHTTLLPWVHNKRIRGVGLWNALRSLELGDDDHAAALPQGGPKSEGAWPWQAGPEFVDPFPRDRASVNLISSSRRQTLKILAHLTNQDRCVPDPEEGTTPQRSPHELLCYIGFQWSNYRKGLLLESMKIINSLWNLCIEG
jgi:hypothetical protein